MPKYRRRFSIFKMADVHRIGLLFLLKFRRSTRVRRANLRHCMPNFVEMLIELSPRGRRDDMPPPRRWQFDSRRIYVRPRTGPQSAHLWCPAVAAALWDRQTTDGRTALSLNALPTAGWLGSRVVSVLDSGAVGPGFKSQSRCCRVTVLGKLFTNQQNW